ncbi:hypothetical protein F8388_013248 [Cannabis sativa]|uniref:Uncharacterized protein n=1 Tax=Cannabis sativa TaxID=3483 RepID=A0A7J6H8Z2_CANSA|nr:hypothetical protein F8388_013248 [Cannabis sativa]KAF4391734.1 hypothetical protein G4B88_005620 [Cannabis sativa]
MFSCKPYEVDSDMPIFADEPVGLEHFLVEPLRKEDWVGDLLDLDAFQIEKCFNMEDISGTFDYDQNQIKLDADTVHPMSPKGSEKNSELSSDKFQDVNTKVHEEYHIDTTLNDKACNFDYGNCKEMGTGGVENQFQGFHRSSSGNKMVDLSSTNTPVLEYGNNHHSSLLDQGRAKELHDTYNMSGREPFMEKSWPKKDNLYDFSDYAELDSSMNLVKVEATSNVSEGETTFSSLVVYSGSVTGHVTRLLHDERSSENQQMKRKRVDGCESLKTSTSAVKVEMCSLDEGDQAGLLVSPKRARKPPKRYIEESLNYDSRSHHRKCGIGRKLKDRILHDGYQKYKWHQKEFHAEVFEDDSFNGGCIQVPFGLPMEKEHSKKNKYILGSESTKDNGLVDQNEKHDTERYSVDSQDEISEDECVLRSSTQKANTRRKRHISWTPEEVVKLVEGVSQCGVGRWTEIKRLLFSSSSHRTSVDLKDKWRNLLRASCTQLHIKEKVEQSRKQASSNYVPDSILCRVRELAVVYPYPRENRSKDSCTVPAVSSFSTGSSNALVPLSTVV